MSTRQQIKRESLKKRNEKLTQRANKLKLEKLNKSTISNKRGRKVDKPKKLSNLPKEGTRAGLLKMGGQGMSGLKNYKKDELKLSKAATKASAELKKKRNQKKNEGSSATKTKSGRIKVGKAMLKRGTVGAKRAERLEAAKERAKAMARKRLGK